MAWYDIISDIGELAELLKSYLWSWVYDTARYAIESIGITYSYFTEWVNYLKDNTLYYYERSKEYAEGLSEEIWHETDLIWDKIGAIPVLTKDVVTGWVTPLIENVKVYAEDLVNDVITVYDVLIKDLTTQINKFEQWIKESPEWLITLLYAEHVRIVEFIADFAEDILDRIFTEEEET